MGSDQRMELVPVSELVSCGAVSEGGAEWRSHELVVVPGEEEPPLSTPGDVGQDGTGKEKVSARWLAPEARCLIVQLGWCGEQTRRAAAALASGLCGRQKLAAPELVDPRCGGCTQEGRVVVWALFEEVVFELGLCGKDHLANARKLDEERDCVLLHGWGQSV